MQTTTIIAADTRAALNRAAELLGPDAVIVETRKTRRGVEVVAGVGPAAPYRPLRAEPKSDPMVRFIAQARAVGVEPEMLADELASCGDDLADVWSRYILRFQDELAIAPPPHRDLSHLCVVGDSGSAKTTTLAQIAALARRADPREPIAFLAGDRRLGAREQLRVIAGTLGIAIGEPAAGETLADAVGRLGAGRRLFIDMPSDPRLAACEVDELRARFGRHGTLTILCTLPLNGQLARHRQIAGLFARRFDGYVLTHAGDTLPPGAALQVLLGSGIPLAGIGRGPDFTDGLDQAQATSLARMVAAALSAGGSTALQ